MSQYSGISRNTISKILRRIKGRGGAEKFRWSSTEKYLRWKLVK